MHRSKYDEMVERLAAVAGNMKVGDPLDEDTIVGPVISAAQRERIESYVAAGGDEGADIVVDGRRPGHIERGYYVAPTLIAGCKPEMKPVKEEIFGPVVVVLPFDDDDEAVAIANSTDFGLYDYVMTERHRARLPPRRSAAFGQRRHQHRAAQHGDAVRRLQDERHRA